MTPQDRDQVKALFEATRLLAPAARAAFWSSRRVEPDVRDEVESLLAAYDTSPAFLEDSALRLADLIKNEGGAIDLAGRRIGPWRLEREIGRGGMGVVWEARRDDREYEARVAIKLLASACLAPGEVERFREERRILARLDHPHIARLIDAGTSVDGYPYLVMDFVAGEPLDQWCERRDLSLAARLRLLLTVCDAVEYAHRRLVIHRDLKPANILVTTEGAPKLLDFGIARLVGARDARAESGARALTPGYASPEQVRGEESTTASDVYSLGVLLYRLLTGASPYGDEALTPVATIRAICDSTPPPPSRSGCRFAPQLRGELDAVVLRALRKNPEERYGSVAALAADLSAWLEHRPLQAYPGSAWSRGWKLVRRNRAVSAAAALAALSLIVGATVSAWQAGVAYRERRRAEARFTQVRRFSRSLIFELHEAIRGLPGATPARTLLLGRATEFLDGLAADESSDTVLKLELAEGYRRLGHVQGRSFSDNIGRPDDALVSFRKAARLGEQAMAAAPGQTGPLILLMGAYDDLSDTMTAQGDAAQAEHYYDLHRALVERAEHAPRPDPQLRLAIATSYSSLAFFRSQKEDMAGAKELYNRAIRGFSELRNARADTAEGRTQLAFALKRLGAILITENALAEAEKRYREALAIESEGLASDPGNVRRQVDRTLTLADLALIAKRRQDLSGAAAAYEEVVRVRRHALQVDERNSRHRVLAMSGISYLAGVYSAQGRHDDAIAVSLEGVRLGAGFGPQATYRERWQTARARVALAHMQLDAARARPAARARLLAGASTALAPVARFLQESATRSPSPSDRNLRVDYDNARKSLAELSPK
jgi:non-specific serine/threonine protein kinase/serine/threonine-protein kinase